MEPVSCSCTLGVYLGRCAQLKVDTTLISKVLDDLRSNTRNHQQRWLAWVAQSQQLALQQAVGIRSNKAGVLPAGVPVRCLAVPLRRTYN